MLDVSRHIAVAAASVATLILVGLSTGQSEVFSPAAARAALLVSSSAMLAIGVLEADARYVLAPLPLSAWLISTFYSAIPAAGIALLDSAALAMTKAHMRAALVEQLVAYPSSTAEVEILRHASLLLIGGAALVLALHRQNRARGTPVKSASPSLFGAAMIFVAGVATLGLWLAVRHLPAGEFFVGNLRDGAVPIMILGVVATAASASSRARAFWLVVQLVVLFAMALMFEFLKAACFGALAAAVICAFASCRDWRRAGMLAIGLVVAAPLVFVAQGLTRNIWKPENFADSRALMRVTMTVFAKLVERQAETGWCLDNVMERHLGEPAAASPFYFMGALIPRLVWPEKPILSRGSDYAQTYCGLSGTTIDLQRPHSASITNLGEPVIQAGRTGLVVAQIALLVMLGGLTWLAFRTAGSGVILLAALLPWLVDFDQSFALYVANAVKMALFMVPGFMFLSWQISRE